VIGLRQTLEAGPRDRQLPGRPPTKSVLTCTEQWTSKIYRSSKQVEPAIKGLSNQYAQNGRHRLINPARVHAFRQSTSIHSGEYKHENICHSPQKPDATAFQVCRPVSMNKTVLAALAPHAIVNATVMAALAV
jgi:hypothetical protein